MFRTDEPIGESVPIASLEVEETPAELNVPSANGATERRGRHNGAQPLDGEMGARLRSDIDWILKLHDCHSDEATWPSFEEFPWQHLEELIAEIRTDESTLSSRGSPAKPVDESVTLPPVSAELGDVETAVVEEVVGALPQSATAETSPLEPQWRESEPSAWEAVVDPEMHGSPDDVHALVQRLEESPEARSAALMSSMERARQTLLDHSSSTAIDKPVELPIADLVVMSRALLSRLR